MALAAVYLGVDAGPIKGIAGSVLLLHVTGVSTSPYLSQRLALKESWLLGWSPCRGGALLAVGVAGPTGGVPGEPSVQC
jgi:hypothetical protein